MKIPGNTETQIMSDKSFYQACSSMSEAMIHTAHQHIKNWKIMAIGCCGIIIVQCITIGYLLTRQREYVYVAKINAGEQIENVIQIDRYTSPDKTVKLAFIQQYIERLMSLSIDPVLMKKNWLTNYQFSGNRARNVLTHFIQTESLIKKIGEETRQINIRTFNTVSENSYQFTWDVTTFNQLGKKEKTVAWSGLFTLSSHDKKKHSSEQELLNPFGIQIEFFSINQLGM